MFCFIKSHVAAMQNSIIMYFFIKEKNKRTKSEKVNILGMLNSPNNNIHHLYCRLYVFFFFFGLYVLCPSLAYHIFEFTSFLSPSESFRGYAKNSFVRVPFLCAVIRFCVILTRNDIVPLLSISLISFRLSLL